MPQAPLRDRILSALSRKTSTGQFIPEVDGLRFICIAMVVLFHLNGYVAARSTAAYTVGPDADPVAWLLGHGSWGVHLFFIISGFVLALPSVSHYQAGTRKVPLRDYFARRLTRLEPPYVAALATSFLLLIAFAGGPRPSLRELAAHLFYVHNLAYGWESGIMVVAWSLEIEVQFYVVAPLLGALFFTIRHAGARRAAIAGAALLAIVAQLAFVPAGIVPHPHLLHFIQYFLAGFLLADLYVTAWHRAPRTHWSWDLLWLLGWAGMIAAWSSGSRAFLAVCFPIAALAAFVAGFRGVFFRRCIRNPWIVAVGGMCYTIYLLHYPIVSAVGRVSAGWARGGYYGADLLVQALVVVPVVLLVSAAFFVLVERPCMDRDWPRKMRDRIGSLRLGGRPSRSPAENRSLP